jgi:hypothetical protein
MRCVSSPYLPFRYSRIARSAASAFFTSMSSKYPLFTAKSGERHLPDLSGWYWAAS